MVTPIKRGGKLVTVGGSLVTNEECCCENCLEDCVDSTISADIPDLGAITLTSYTPGSPTAGCCYWRNLAPDPAGTGDCTITAVYASLCIVDETVTLSLSVAAAGPVTLKTWSKEYAKCDFCALMPGFAELDPGAGACYDGTAMLTFASSCCHPPDCNCDCYSDADELYFDWVTEPPVGCPLFACLDWEDLPAPPWPLTKISGSTGASSYEYQFENPGGGTFGIIFGCDKISASCDDCDEPFWHNCEYTLVITCSNGCNLTSAKCIKTLPIAGFPITFDDTLICATQSANCFGDCDPWEASISDV